MYKWYKFNQVTIMCGKIKNSLDLNITYMLLSFIVILNPVIKFSMHLCCKSDYVRRTTKSDFKN